MSFLSLILGSADNFDGMSVTSASSCGCYMTNSSCGGSADFGSSGQATQACGQSSLSAQQSSHAQNCPN